MHNCDQRSAEWFAARCGKATASKIADIVRTIAGGKPAASRENYHAQLVAERLTGGVEETFTSTAMAWGTETEAEARNAYCFFRDATVVEVGFIDHPTIEMSGASPDGLVGEDGLVEIKCPNTSTHLKTLDGGRIKPDYITQMQWQMACTGRKWCDFVSYDPRLPAEMSLHVQRIERDQDRINELEEAVRDFLAEVSQTVASLRVKYQQKEAA